MYVLKYYVYIGERTTPIFDVGFSVASSSVVFFFLMWSVGTDLAPLFVRCVNVCVCAVHVLSAPVCHFVLLRLRSVGCNVGVGSRAGVIDVLPARRKLIQASSRIASNEGCLRHEQNIAAMLRFVFREGLLWILYPRWRNGAWKNILSKPAYPRVFLKPISKRDLKSNKKQENCQKSWAVCFLISHHAIIGRRCCLHFLSWPLLNLPVRFVPRAWCSWKCWTFL